MSVLPEEDAAGDIDAGADGAGTDATVVDANAGGDASTSDATSNDATSTGNDATISDASSDATDAGATNDGSLTDAQADVVVPDLDADTHDANVDSGDFCTGKADGTPCASFGRWACCAGECRSLQTKNNCGGCGITCPDNGSCLTFGTYPNIGNVCSCGNNTGCPTKQSCLVVPQTDTCDCQLDGAGCAADQTCKTSINLTIPRRYCSY